MAFDLSAIRERARRLRIDALALGLAVGHPGTPWYAKLLVAGLVAYVVTPVDLAPDVVPVLGIVDDLIFIPVALALAARLVPGAVLAECRARASAVSQGAKMRRITRVALIAVWGGVALVAVLLALYAA